MCGNLSLFIQSSDISCHVRPRPATDFLQGDIHHIFAAELKKTMFHQKDLTMRKRILLAFLGASAAVAASAQGQGLAGINEATSLMTSYFDPATKLCYAIGAVLGLVGGIKTYSKFSSGDPDTSKTAASWFFACIFLIVAATILRSFFL